MAAKNPNGAAILRASLDLFRQDPQMIWLPVMATATSLAAFFTISLPLLLAIGHTGIPLFVSLLAGSVVATAATVIFNVALVFAATDRIEGRTPTVAGALTQAWGRRRVIFQWAVLGTVVGTGIRLLEERLGLLGRILGFAGGLAWIVATYLVIPVLAFENVGPIDAVKRSSTILKDRFGTVSRSGLRFGALFVGLSIPAILVAMIGVILIVKHAIVIGVLVAVVGFAGVIGVGMVASAAGMYMRTILYRFATDQPIPELGVNVSNAFSSW